MRKHSVGRRKSSRVFRRTSKRIRKINRVTRGGFML
jgi:hypothetical protein